MLLSGTVRRTLYTIVLLAMLPALGTIVYSSMDRRERTIRATYADAAEVVGNICIQKQQVTENTRALLLATSLIDEIANRDAAASKKIFLGIMQKIPYYSNLTLLAPDGTFVASALPLVTERNIIHEPHVAEAVKRNDFAIGESAPGMASGLTTLRFAFPVRSHEGLLLGIIAGGIQVDRYTAATTEEDLPEGAQIRLLDQDGTSFFSAPHAELTPEDAAFEWQALQKQHRIRGAFTLELPSGKKSILTYQNLFLPDAPAPYMTVLLSMPESAPSARANAALWRDLALMGIAVIAAFAITRLVGRRTIVMPVRTLLRTARMLGRGNLDARMELPYLKGEMGVLANAFNEMASALETRNLELTRAQKASDEDNRSKGEFLANMSHEIRTPMNAVIGLAYLAMKTPLSSKQFKYIERIYIAANTLLGIINDILDFSKIESGQLHIEHVPFRLDDILDNLSVVISQKAEERELEFLFRVAKDVPDTLVGDPLRLGQILTNLGSNAVKFTEKGEIIVTCEVDDEAPPAPCPELEQTQETAEAPLPSGKGSVRLRFTVRDSGIGMTEEHLSRLFTAFSQADSSSTRRFGGTGLGLTITKHLLKLMDGSIHVDSTHGKGTTVTFTACFGVAAVSSGQAAAPAQESQSTLPLSGMRVLIVDDNPVACEVLAAQLQDFSLHTAVAPSAQQAFEMLKAAEEQDTPFHIVFMDWRMPVMDGIEATYHVLNTLELAQPPSVLLVTAFGRSEIIAQAERAGAAGVLYKPMSKTLLQAAIDNISTGRECCTLQDPGEVQLDHPQHHSLPGVRVLLVEDNPVNQEVAAELLREAGAEVHIAENGVEALALLAKTPPDWDFHIVLMDLQMPEMDGYEATRRIRMQPQYDSLPIIAMTAHAMVEERQRCLAIGMNDHISKPIEIEKFFAALTTWLAPHEPAREQASFAPPVPGFDFSPAPLLVAGLPPSAIAAQPPVQPTIQTDTAQEPDRQDLSEMSAPAAKTGSLENDASAPENTEEQRTAVKQTQWHESADSLPPLAGLDVRLALTRLAGNVRIYKKILLQFHAHQAGIPMEFERALRNGDMETAHRIAHTLKGLAGSIGASTLATHASRLEMLLRSPGNEDAVRAQAETCFAALARILDMLDSVAHKL